MTTVLTTHDEALGIPALSAALGVPRATAYRWRRPPRAERSTPTPHVPSPRALAPAEQTRVLDLLHSVSMIV